MFCLTPISKVFKNAMDDNTDGCAKMLKAVGVTLTKDDLELRQKPLLKRCMQKWLPAHDALLEMLVQHLPSPAAAQKQSCSATSASRPQQLRLLKFCRLRRRQLGDVALRSRLKLEQG